MDIQEAQQSVNFVHQDSHDILADFLGGYAFGHAMGIGIQSITKWWTVIDVKLKIGDPVTRVVLGLLYSC